MSASFMAQNPWNGFIGATGRCYWAHIEVDIPLKKFDLPADSRTDRILESAMLKLDSRNLHLLLASDFPRRSFFRDFGKFFLCLTLFESAASPLTLLCHIWLTV